MTVAVIMYKGMGISNTDIALYTSWLYLPWVIKPLWSPVVDILKTRRLWIWIMQIIIGGGLAGVALSIPSPNFFQYTLAFFWILAFSSATQDIAIDGFYLLATTEKEQAFFVGIRSTFYRISTIFGQGLLVILAGYIQNHTGLPKVNLHVDAKPGVALVQSINPQPAIAAPLDGELRIVAQQDRIEISPEARPKSEVSNHLLRLPKATMCNPVFITWKRKPRRTLLGGIPISPSRLETCSQKSSRIHWNPSSKRISLRSLDPKVMSLATWASFRFTSPNLLDGM